MKNSTETNDRFESSHQRSSNRCEKFLNKVIFPEEISAKVNEAKRGKVNAKRKILQN